MNELFQAIRTMFENAKHIQNSTRPRLPYGTIQLRLLRKYGLEGIEKAVLQMERDGEVKVTVKLDPYDGVTQYDDVIWLG